MSEPDDKLSGDWAAWERQLEGSDRMRGAVRIGFRSWVWNRGRKVLVSCVSDATWPADGDMQATCEKAHKDGVPNTDHTCGIYAAADLGRAAPYTGIGHVFGLVYGWGTVIDGEVGWRAQWARIAAMFDIVPEVSLPNSDLRRIAKIYDVPLIRPHSLSLDDYTGPHGLVLAVPSDLDAEFRRVAGDGES